MHMISGDMAVTAGEVGGSSGADGVTLMPSLMKDAIRKAGNTALKSRDLCAHNPGYRQKKEESVDTHKAYSSFHQC